MNYEKALAKFLSYLLNSNVKISLLQVAMAQSKPKILEPFENIPCCFHVKFLVTYFVEGLKKQGTP